MQPIFRSFITHKLTESENDCQDSLFVPSKDSASPRLFAVADGATASFFSRLWAKELTEQFAERPELALKKETWAEWLEVAHSRWRARVEEFVKEPGASFLTVNGFHSRAVAASTFVGLRLGEPEGERWPWQAVVHGDSCLFHLRANRMKPYGPKSLEDFGYMVDAVKSYPKEHPSEPECFSGSGDGEDAAASEGDVFILATDALAQWLTRRAHNGKPVWSAVLTLDTQAAFEKLVEQARTEANDAMVNDDVAVVIVTFGSKPHASYLEPRYEPESKPAKTVAPLAPTLKPSEKTDPQPDLQPQQLRKQMATTPPRFPKIIPLKISRKEVLLGLQIAAFGVTILFGVLWQQELAERKRLGDEKAEISKNLKLRETDLANEKNRAEELRKRLAETERQVAQANKDAEIQKKEALAPRRALADVKAELARKDGELKQAKIELDKQGKRPSTAAILSKFDELNNFLQQKAQGSSDTAKEAIQLFEKAKNSINEIPQERQHIGPAESGYQPANPPAIPPATIPVTSPSQNPTPEKD